MSGICGCWTYSACIGGVIDAAEMVEFLVAVVPGGLVG